MALIERRQRARRCSGAMQCDGRWARTNAPRQDPRRWGPVVREGAGTRRTPGRTRGRSAALPHPRWLAPRRARALAPPHTVLPVRDSGGHRRDRGEAWPTRRSSSRSASTPCRPSVLSAGRGGPPCWRVRALVRWLRIAEPGYSSTSLALTIGGWQQKRPRPYGPGHGHAQPQLPRPRAPADRRSRRDGPGHPPVLGVDHAT